MPAILLRCQRVRAWFRFGLGNFAFTDDVSNTSDRCRVSGAVPGKNGFLVRDLLLQESVPVQEMEMIFSVRFKAACVALLMIFCVSCGAAERRNDNHFVGFWELSFDEDGFPKDTMEIRADGTYIAHGWSCRTSDEAPYHVHDGNLYVTFQVPEKGPIAIVFRRDKDGRLSFTSPRTRNNAYYTRLKKNPCP